MRIGVRRHRCHRAGILAPSSASAATAVSAPQKSCTFTWFNIDDRDVLTAVSEAKTLPKGEKWVPSMQVSRSGVAQVTGVTLDSPPRRSRRSAGR
ncbi:MAG: hypothetical protein K0R62_2442 [Nonomuraea muscovyensis]|nr:hypothetical protein [Nonomuraea muscovyensis]